MSMQVHLDLGSGMAGDMFLAACLDLGLDREALESALRTLPLPPWTLRVSRERRHGIAGCRVAVDFPPEGDHRHWREIADLIGGSGLPDPVKERALAIFQILATAEGKVHGIDPDAVHFHEVGAVDALVDICGAAYAIWKLDFGEVTASRVALGGGTVVCRHGRLPVPVPAVAEMVCRYGIPVEPSSVEGELLTPTGAAILVHLVSRYGPATMTRIERIGYGLGEREVPGRPNVLRLLASGEGTAEVRREWVGVLTTHVDDMNPEWYGGLWEQLFAAGVWDVALFPMTMKKGRPGVRIEVMVAPGREDEIALLLLRHSTALGVRRDLVERLVLLRRHVTCSTPWGVVRVVEASGVRRVEYEDLVAVALREQWPLPVAYQHLLPYLATPSPHGG